MPLGIRFGLLLAALLALQAPAAAAPTIVMPDLNAITQQVNEAAAQAAATAAAATAQAEALAANAPANMPSDDAIAAMLAQSEAANGVIDPAVWTQMIDAALAGVPAFDEIDALLEQAKQTVAGALATLDQIPDAPCIPGINCPGDITVATPEPATTLLLGTALAGLGWRLRRRPA